MADDGWGANDGWDNEEGGAPAAEESQPAGGGGGNSCRKCNEEGHYARDCPNGGDGGGDGCRKCGEEGHYARDCPNKPSGGGGDGKCRNCKEEGHMAADCPMPEMCRRCRKEGHKMDECPEPAKCYNCRQEGHMTSECPEPEKCRRCKQEGHKVADCPEPQICNRCGEEGHMVRECTQEEQTRTYEDAEGNQKEVYVPKADCPEDELFKLRISAGINFEKYKDIPVKVTGENVPPVIESFEGARLRDLLMENVKKSGYSVPTPIQKHGIPIISGGRDMMGCAQTGSGKTAAFLLPIVNKLIATNADSGAGGKACPQAVIVTPTRELAQQIYQEARKFCAGSVLKCRVAFGGTSSSFQNSRLMQGCNILVSTTGRLLDFVDKNLISFENLEFFVLDEADRMLDDGFMPDVERATSNPSMPAKDKRQTLMFSATFSDDVQAAAQDFLKEDYLFITVGVIGGFCSDVKQEFIKVEQFDKREKLEELLNDPERNPLDRTLIFVQTKKNADFITANLLQSGLEANSIHGDRFLSQRFEALENFKSGLKPILVATSVAARGLDISGVELVINYDLPREVDDYVHRIGRTGRVGNPGRAITFVDEAENADVVKLIVAKLVAAETPVEDWLNDVANSATGGGGSDAGGDAGAGDDEDWS